MFPMFFNSPISSETADRLVRRMEFRSSGRALDAGCGTGEFLLRVVAHHEMRGLGIDQDPRCISAAMAAASARGLAARCEFCAGDVKALEKKPSTFDLGICIGSTHAFGVGDAAYPNAIDSLKHLVRPGGIVLS